LAKTKKGPCQFVCVYLFFWFFQKFVENPNKKIAHPKRGNGGGELGLVILIFCFFGFLVSCVVFFGGFCLAIAGKPNRNCQ